jgi:hypothetical protein
MQTFALDMNLIVRKPLHSGGDYVVGYTETAHEDSMVACEMEMRPTVLQDTPLIYIIYAPQLSKYYLYTMKGQVYHTMEAYWVEWKKRDLLLILAVDRDDRPSIPQFIIDRLELNFLTCGSRPGFGLPSCCEWAWKQF